VDESEKVWKMTTVVSYGAGTNSTAMLVGLYERGERPDLILFADTGGERPETYKHLEDVSNWCMSVGFPEIQSVIQVKRDGTPNMLYDLCISNNMLPSIAYGFKSCSMKHKRAPQDKFVNHWQPANDTWKEGSKVVKLIGYDADEEKRAKIEEDDKYSYRYPLIEWGWGRDECVEAITRAGLPQPGKSACFFCPSSKPKEILSLKRDHPDLFARAVAMERNAELTHIKGLGRNFSWEELVKWNDAQIDMFNNPIESPCGCYDGDSE
jgi:hypothetical protein